jgi:arabinogalactan endo-1,4-beta-galactosidase
MISDGWSNPMTQPIPKSWQELSPKQLEKAMYDFVFDTMDRLRKEGLLPEIVQIGNEISNGTLWPSGRVFYGDEKRDKSNWLQFTSYIKAGIQAVRDVDKEGKVRIMIHVDFGGDIGFSDTFFTKMEEYGVEYDIAGFSFYPWSHGTLMDLRDNLAFVTKRFGKPVIVVETGFYSVPSRYFERNGNIAAFPETPEGQKQWFQAVNDIVMAVPDNMGLGVFWWEPMFRGRGFFDDETHVVKPVVDAFRRYTMPPVRTDGNPRVWDFDER